MSINGVNNQTYINIYNSNSNKVTAKTSQIKISDTIEISSLGKSLNKYSLNSEIDSAKRVAEIKRQVESGTYNVDAKLTATSMLNAMKEDNS